MNPAAAIEAMRSSFPFPGYLSEDGLPYLNIAETVLRHLPRGSRILDFGAGPCDKTAVVRQLGYACSACDDLQDDWHKFSNNVELIQRFAEKMELEFRTVPGQGPLGYTERSFDMVMLHDVLEHLHDSPRELLNELVGLLVDSGLLLVTVPNAVRFDKRFSVMLGRSNLTSYDSYYWSSGPWRGHVREYVRSDLMYLARYLGLPVVELRSCDHQLGRIPQRLRPAYLRMTTLFPGLKDTWLLLARKPAGWRSRKELSRAESARILAQQLP